jgi:hypothetical protein
MRWRWRLRRRTWVSPLDCQTCSTRIRGLTGLPHPHLSWLGPIRLVRARADEAGFGMEIGTWFDPWDPVMLRGSFSPLSEGTSVETWAEVRASIQAAIFAPIVASVGLAILREIWPSGFHSIAGSDGFLFVVCLLLALVSSPILLVMMLLETNDDALRNVVIEELRLVRVPPGADPVATCYSRPRVRRSIRPR